MRRSRISRSKSKRNFRNHTAPRLINIKQKSFRGGIRL